MSEKQKEEELDLGQFLIIIGKGISSMLKAVSNVINWLFNVIILFLIFIRSHFIKISIVALILGSLGAVYQYVIKEKVYESSMTVQPNFGSAVQLYKNIDFYQSLVDQKDYEKLGESLNLTTQEAQSITEVIAKPYDNENQILLSYQSFITNLDTTTVKLIDYETFASKQPVESFRYHVVSVQAKNKFLFNKLEAPIIESIVQNDYYSKVKSTAYQNLISRKNALTASMSELDTLRNLYKEVMLAESQKDKSGTNLYMGDTKSNTKEVMVFDKFMSMNQELIEVNRQLTEENEVINVVSSFNSIGNKVGGWYKNFAFLGFVAGIILTLLVLGLKSLNVYLDQAIKQKD